MLSSRNTWTLYDVNMHTGGYNWLLGDGRHSSFKLGPGVRFYWQHDAEFQPGGLISLFNNASDPPKERESSGLLLRPNFSSHTVTLVKRFANPSKTLLASSQGDTLSLSGGDWLLGYGGLPNFTEFSSSGHVLLDGTLGKNVQDFRTYLFPWSGQPTTAPAIAVQATAAGASVYASWNGATDVASWQVFLSPPTPLAGKPRAAHDRGPQRLSDDDPGERVRRHLCCRASALSHGAGIGDVRRAARPLIGPQPPGPPHVARCLAGEFVNRGSFRRAWCPPRPRTGSAARVRLPRGAASRRPRRARLSWP